MVHATRSSGGRGSSDSNRSGVRLPKLPTRLRPKKATSLKNFIHSRTREEWSPLRLKVDHCIGLKQFDWCLGALIVLNIVLIVVETDSTARNADPAEWTIILDRILSLAYLLELCARIFVHRLAFLGSFRDLLDLVIVVSDVITFSLLSFSDDGSIPSLGFLKIFRMIRLVRVLKLMTMIPELQMMMKGLAFATKPIAWGMLLIVVCLLVWSILGVQFIHPLVQEAARNGAYQGCDRCERAFSSVGQTMLTFTQTLIAGDSWGLVTIPVVEAHPEAYLFFLLALMTNSIGVLNLILAVIVDSAMEARKQTDHEIAMEKEALKIEAKKRLTTLCEILDKDQSGTLTLDELKDGLHENEDFADAMDAMDIAEGDMDAVFHILDADRSGTVVYEEFVQQMQELRSNDAHTLLIFIKYYTKDIHERLHDQISSMQEDIASIKALQKDPDRGSAGGEFDGIKMVPGSHKIVSGRPEIEEDFAQDRSSVSGASHHCQDGEDPGCGCIDADLAQLKASVDASLQAACADMLRMLDVDELRKRVLELPPKAVGLVGTMSTDVSVSPKSQVSTEGALSTVIQRSVWSQRPTPPLPDYRLGRFGPPSRNVEG